MTFPTILIASLQWVLWEAALFAASLRIARLAGWNGVRLAEEEWLAVLSIEVILESSLATLYTFWHLNMPYVYWITAAVCATFAISTRSGRAGLRRTLNSVSRLSVFRSRWAFAVMACLVTPLVQAD